MKETIGNESFSLLSNCTSGGCGAKIGPGELSSLLEQFPILKNHNPQNGNLLVGFDSSDDAAVYALDGGKAIISTVDFFSPVADDPFVFGQIAAANAMSDVYAMGGTPVLALNLLCVPENFPKSIPTEILAGGADKIAEAGAVLGGGHSIYDRETKYGLAVTGIIDRKDIIRNNTPQSGHSLILTKPLGVGIVMAAERVGAASGEAVHKAVESMRRLNRYAAEKMRGFSVSACTDVTGFGLLCHLLEMCGGTMTAEIWPENVPFISEAAVYAEDFLLTAAAQRNRNHFSTSGSADTLPFVIQELMFDPQTSGGLLICVDSEQSHDLLTAIQMDDPAARIIGCMQQRQNDIIVFRG